MGCSTSKAKPHEAQCCCPCCGCCIVPPGRAVLYDEELDEDHVLGAPPKRDNADNAAIVSEPHHDCQASSNQTSDISSNQPNTRGIPIRLATPAKPGATDAIYSQGAMHDGVAACSDTDTAVCEPSLPAAADDSSAPQLPPLEQQPSSARWGMPSNLPPIPGLNFCMNARSLKTLRAHLSAKGFAIDPSVQQAAQVDPATTPAAPSAHRWHSVHSANSGCSPLVSPAGEPVVHSPRYPSDLASQSWAGWHDASSQVAPPSPTGSHSDAASDDVWRDIIEEEGSEGTGSATSSTRSYIHRSESSGSDVSDDDRLSSTTFKTATSPVPAPAQRRTRSGPFQRPERLDKALAAAASLFPSSLMPQSHSMRRHTPGSRGPGSGTGRGQSWAASVHMAQASIAAEDLAHTQGGDGAHPALDAFKAGRLSFAFSGGGFFFPYHLGCVIALKDMGIISDATPLAGASCGSIITACVNSGLDLHMLVGRLLEFAADCRTYGTAGRLRDVIVTFMTANLPPDAHLRCRGRTFISLTKVFPYLHPYIIADYTSKEDLVHAIATSCHIPAYCDGSFMARFRSHWFVDGGLVRHIPALPAEAGAAHVAGVSCVPFKFLESLPGVSRLQMLHSLAVSPDMFGTFPFGWHEVGGLVLAPAEDPVLLQMVEMGKRDITAWASAVGLTAYIASTRAVPAPLRTATTPGRMERAPHQPAPLGPEAGQEPAAAATRADGQQPRKIKHRVRERPIPAPIVSPFQQVPPNDISPAQPGGLPQSVEDDWHDAVENQSFIQPGVAPCLAEADQQTSSSSSVEGAAVLRERSEQQKVPLTEGTSTGPHPPAAAGGGRPSLHRSSVEVAEHAVRKGMLEAANAVAGPLHMDAGQAMDALSGTSTLGLAQAAAHPGTSYSYPHRQMQVLQVTGGKCRGLHAGVAPVAAQAAMAHAQPLPAGGVPVTHVPTPPTPGWVPEAVANANLSNPEVAPTGPSGRVVDASFSSMQPYCLDIDVDASQWGAAGMGGGSAGAAAGQHTVQVKACVNGQPVVLELRLHMPAGSVRLQ